MGPRDAFRRNGALAVVGAGLWLARPIAPEHVLLPPHPAPAEDRAGGAGAGADDTRLHAFRIPAGTAPTLTCEAAQTIVAQARTQLGYPPEPIDSRGFADATADWLDPYGLWSVSPDTPVSASFRRRADELLADLEGRHHGRCDAARALGASLASWAGELRAVFDEARRHASPEDDGVGAVAAPAFEGATVTRPARTLASTLGRRIGAIERDLGGDAPAYASTARARYFPELDAEGWSGVVLAAAVRAYVPAIDPHGAWAPMDEESSVYEVDLEARPPSRLWDKAERTAIGLEIESGALAPLHDGDTVLSIAGVMTAGLSFEQVEQLGYAVSDARPPAQAVVLRRGARAPVTTSLDGASAEDRDPAPGAQDADELPTERVAYGDGDVVLVAIHDVRDDLGDQLKRALLRERQGGARPLAGVVLDLRGNGGGSTDGAIDALGLFLPGAPLFPMRRRDGSIETDRAPEPPGVDRWRGPVAVLVDSETASAAEMIAGALAAYRRGPIVGARTFGKGCAQEYLDDDAHAGVLRLTTLLYALPDGAPVQRVGLSPTVRFPFPVPDGADREALLPHAPPTWRGPDVRDRTVVAHAEDGTWAVAWPPSSGNVGPCKDADTCRALRALGTPATARRKSGKGR